MPSSVAAGQIIPQHGNINSTVYTSQAWNKALGDAERQGNASTRQPSEPEIILAAYQPLDPPGDCTSGQYKVLRDAVVQACKQGERRCTASDDLPTLDKKIERNAACIAAREQLNNTCFRGGDEGHRNAVDEAVNTQVRCQKLKANKEEEAKKEMQEGLRDGAKRAVEGAVVYWIISEGSRILFPPRNLVPVP